MKKVLLFAMLVFATGLLFSCSSDDPESSSGSAGSLSYGGQTYETVKIGEQTWMAENLNYNPGTGTSTCYDNGPNNCNTYGRLYDWSTAMGLSSICNSKSCSSQIQAKHRGICPSGWHIPSDADWDKLFRFVDSENDGDGDGTPYDSYTAGKHLKAQSGWEPYSGIENLDTYGFSALPGGRGHSSENDIISVGDMGNWWSASEDDSYHAYRRIMSAYYDTADWDYGGKNYLYSVRCLQD
ncbi:MAG: hypothetical protein LBQ87_04380 [Candidatus Fibromonas sp.]|jgi:uncharacterized protein (TIGR02145 family)|nr:hypothetical protein [Candidatus Fibromonas sp.]